MSSDPVPPGRAGGGSPAISIRPIPPSEWPAALRLLFQSFPEEERESRLEATLAAVAGGNLSLDGLRQATAAGCPLGVSLTMSQPDGITLVWPPVVLNDDDRAGSQAVRQALLADVCGRLDAEGARLGQVLLDAADELTAAPMRSAGFATETQLFFLARSLTEPIPEEADELPWKGTPYSSETHTRFARLLEATYRDSLDCPLLEGIRTGDEALASHRLSGQFDPCMWQIFTMSTGSEGEEVDLGVCLLNDHPDQDAVELTYFGVHPEYRGQGLGRSLLIEALRGAAARARSAMFLAVDAQNAYANRLYGELGFVELARRVALFRLPGGSARQSSTGN